MKIKKLSTYGGSALGGKINHGFTIIDLLVSMAIMTLLTLTSVISFIQAERNQNLSNAAEVLASQIREIENMAIAGKEVELPDGTFQVPAGGYGIQFVSDGVDISHLFFADMNRDLVYDESIPPSAYFPYSDQEIALRSQYSFHQDVFISKVEKDGLEVNLQTNPLDLIFKTPDAKVYVDGKTNVSWVSIKLGHLKIDEDKWKTIKIYPLSRQISVE